MSFTVIRNHGVAGVVQPAYHRSHRHLEMAADNAVQSFALLSEAGAEASLIEAAGTAADEAIAALAIMEARR